MNRFIISIFFLFTLSAIAQSAPAGIAFTSAPQAVAAGAISETITIQAQDASGNPFKLPSTGCLSLSSSASGEFSSSASSWSAVSVLTMNKNSANRNFYYKNTAAGAHTLTARLVLKPESEERSCANWPVAEWPAGWTATQDIIIGSASTSSGNDMASSTPMAVSAPAPATAGAGAQSELVPSLSVKISGPATVTVGADVVFSAIVFGLKKEPILNARVVWSFGNGAVKEGSSVRYGYNIPGSYAVVVDASSGGFAGSARIAVVARKPNVRVSGVSSGANGFVEIENKSNAELDVSGWGLASAGSIFTIPDRMIILPSAKVAFPSEVTKLSLAGDDARLLFPNGTLAAKYVVSPTPVNIPRPDSSRGTPLKVGIKNSPLGGSAPSEARGSDASVATTTPASIALFVSDTTSNGSIGKWLLGVLGACIVGVGAFVAFHLRPNPQETKSDTEKLAEEISIDAI